MACFKTNGYRLDETCLFDSIKYNFSRSEKVDYIRERGLLLLVEFLYDDVTTAVLRNPRFASPLQIHRLRKP
jgi:hypothetical protein